MALFETIDRTLQALIASKDGGDTGTAATPTQLRDFVRPIFLKLDPADGAEQFYEVIGNPMAEQNRTLIESYLRSHLSDHPEAVNKLNSLLDGE